MTTAPSANQPPWGTAVADESGWPRPTARSVHVIGNIQLDVLASPVTALPEPGGDVVIDRIDVRPAGAAGNAALALHALGCRHRLFGMIGDDHAGVLIHDHLRGLGLANDVRVVPGGATGVSIAVEGPGRERAFWTAHGVLQGQTLAAMGSDCTRGDIVLITGYFTVPALRREAAALMSSTREAGAYVLFDTGWDTDDWAGTAREEVFSLLPDVDIFLPNEAEAAALTGYRDPAAAAWDLHCRCRGWVVVKLGARGALAVDPRGRSWLVPAASVRSIIDTTGAGDSLSAGVVAELAQGKDVLTGLELGVRVASTVIGRPSSHRYPARSELLPAAGPARMQRPTASA